jgi:hypothetical protein
LKTKTSKEFCLLQDRPPTQISPPVQNPAIAPEKMIEKVNAARRAGLTCGIQLRISFVWLPDVLNFTSWNNFKNHQKYRMHLSSFFCGEVHRV